MIDTGPSIFNEDQYFIEQDSYFPLYNENEEFYNSSFELSNYDEMYISTFPCQILPEYTPESSLPEATNPKTTNMKDTTLSGSTHRATKRRVNLSTNEKNFKEFYYQIFTRKKKFPKDLVRDIHEHMSSILNFKKMTREQFRRIDLYFQEYSKYSKQILIYLQKHKEELLKAIPGLSEVY